MASVNTNLSWEGQGVDRLISDGADETVTEVLEFWGSREGARRPGLLPCHRHYLLPRWKSSTNSWTAAVSGAESSRPARNKLLEAARLRQIDLVLVLRLDRWGRSVADSVDTLRLLTS